MGGACGSLLLTGASGAKYIPVAPESMMPVLAGASCECGACEGLQVGGLQGKAESKELLAKLFLELTNTALAVPPRHKQERQLAGRLLAFFSNSKQSSGK